MREAVRSGSWTVGEGVCEPAPRVLAGEPERVGVHLLRRQDARVLVVEACDEQVASELVLIRCRHRRQIARHPRRVHRLPRRVRHTCIPSPRYFSFTHTRARTIHWATPRRAPENRGRVARFGYATHRRRDNRRLWECRHARCTISCALAVLTGSDDLVPLRQEHPSPPPPGVAHHHHGPITDEARGFFWCEFKKATRGALR